MRNSEFLNCHNSIDIIAQTAYMLFYIFKYFLFAQLVLVYSSSASTRFSINSVGTFGRLLKMAPYQKFQTIFKKWIHISSSSLGYNILDKNFKFGVHTASTIALIISSLVFSIYTICTFDMETRFKCASCLSLNIQVTANSLLFGIFFTLLMGKTKHSCP